LVLVRHPVSIGRQGLPLDRPVTTAARSRSAHRSRNRLQKIIAG
jgi:hypothetical protein